MSDQEPPGEPPRPWEQEDWPTQPIGRGSGAEPTQPIGPGGAMGPGGSGGPMGPGGPGGSMQYPRQQLLPQEIKARRSRRPLFLGIGLALALIVGGGVAYLALRDNGENTRAAYCAGLRKITHNGDLMSAVDGADATTLDDLKAVIKLAPNAVADDWDKVTSGIETMQSDSSDYSEALTVFGALRVISQDAKDNCGLDLQIPMI